MKDTFMKDTFRTICLALIVGTLAGAGAATYVLGVDAHVELDRYPGDATGKPPKFWGLQVGDGGSLTAIGVYSGGTATGARHVAPAQLSPKLPE